MPKEFWEQIDLNTEWLQTLEGDEVECISIENLKQILEIWELKEKNWKENQ